MGKTVSKRNTTIEINGKLYDANTGKLLAGTPKKVVKPAIHQAAAKPHMPLPRKQAMHDVIRHPARPVARRKTAGSQTLMRHAVKKPAAHSRRPIKVQGANHSLAHTPMAGVIVSKSAKRVDPTRLHKSRAVARPSLISHFSPSLSQPVVPELVKPAPAPVQPAMLLAARPAAKPKTRHQPKTAADILEVALQNATSHQARPLKAKSKPKKRRAASATVAAVAVFTLAFAGAKELPQLKLHMASAKAGFSASLPNYKPAGYSLGTMDSGPGVVATEFRSNSDDRSYKLIQKESKWTSQELLTNYVKPLGANNTVGQTGGRTVYFYGNGNATWVSAGIWYVIQSHGSLDNRQLLALAESL